MLQTKLSLVYFRDDLYVFLSGETESESECNEEVQLWENAIHHAMQRLSEEPAAHHWWAVIGNGSRMRGHPDPLLDPIQLGPLSLHPADFGYEEIVPDRRSLTAQEIRRWIPVFVDGCSTGYDWEAAAQSAHRELYQLCAVLSLYSKEDWVLRERVEPITRSKQLPEQTETLRRLEESQVAELRRHGISMNRERLAAAWELLQRDERLVRPLSIYYQGRSLIEDYPSFAMVAFVTAVEEGGKLLSLFDTPEERPKRTRPKRPSSRQLFLETLKRTLPESIKHKAKQMTEDYYGGRRSATAHAGRLFGREEVFGEYSFGLAGTHLSSADLFDGELYRMQAAAEDVLHTLLSHPQTPP